MKHAKIFARGQAGDTGSDVEGKGRKGEGTVQVKEVRERGGAKEAEEEVMQSEEIRANPRRRRTKRVMKRR